MLGSRFQPSLARPILSNCPTSNSRVPLLSQGDYTEIPEKVGCSEEKCKKIAWCGSLASISCLVLEEVLLARPSYLFASQGPYLSCPVALTGEAYVCARLPLHATPTPRDMPWISKPTPVLDSVLCLIL